MPPLPRSLSKLALAALLAAPAVVLAQDAPKPADAKPADAAQPAGADAKTTAQAPQINPDLRSAADNFFHYASLARSDLAKAEGEKILAMNAPATEVYAAFQDVVKDRNARVIPERRVELYERMIAWQRNADLKDVTAKLLAIFREANRMVAQDPQYIQSQVERLGQGRRAYEFAVQNLRESGELAVPIMLNNLRDPNKRDLHVPIRNALRAMGQRALNPLLAATEIKDSAVLPWVIASLGDLGYDNAVPALVRIAKDNNQPEPVRNNARDALIRLNVPDFQSMDPAQLFFDLAEKYYYDRASTTPAPGAKDAILWFATDTGLNLRMVPAATFNEDMTMRTCETVLKLNASRGDAVSLWIAAGYKREVELPEGATDALWAEGPPPLTTMQLPLVLST